MAYKAIQLRLYPNREQETLLRKNIGCTRFVFNFFLGKRIKHYEKTGQTASFKRTSEVLTQLKRDSKYEWLNEVNAQSLQQALKYLDQAYSNFFRRVKNGDKPGFPRFKRKGQKESFRVPQGG
jgi:putative transposase